MLFTKVYLPNTTTQKGSKIYKSNTNHIEIRKIEFKTKMIIMQSDSLYIMIIGGNSSRYIYYDLISNLTYFQNI